MDNKKTDAIPTFSRPVQQIVTMLFISVLIGVGGWLIHGQVIDIMRTNPLLNGFIAAVFLLGVLTCFWQVFILVQSVSWIESFARRDPRRDAVVPPTLLAPLASLLRARGSQMQISSASMRSILESVATRIDEARDITRYLANLLVFLGLLGTFYGLATTVPAVVETIRSLAPQEGETGLDVFGKLMTGLEEQLGGMGTAFSSSLLGLAGSLVVGLLELFAGHGQNRFYRELEEWLSSITRLGFSSGEGDAGDTQMAGVMMDAMTEQMEAVQLLYAQTGASAEGMDARLVQLTEAVDRLAKRLDGGGEQAALLAKLASGQDRIGQIAAGLESLTRTLKAEAGQTDALSKIAEGQDRLIAALTGAEGGAHSDAESRMRLRSIDVQLLRILEELSAGRQESMADLRGDLMALTGAIRQLSRGPTGRG